MQVRFLQEANATTGLSFASIRAQDTCTYVGMLIIHSAGIRGLVPTLKDQYPKRRSRQWISRHGELLFFKFRLFYFYDPVLLY
jgi:hypothetical protein